MQLIFGFVFLGLLLVVGSFLLRPTPPAALRAPRVGGAAVLRPPRGRNAILSTMAVGPTILVVAVALTSAKQEPLRPVGLAMVAAAVVLGLLVTLYFLAAEFRLRVLVDDAGVARITPLLSRRLAWGDVERIAYNGVSRWFVLTSRTGAHLWIPENMSGIGDFADAAIARLRPEVLRGQPDTFDALKQVAEEAREEDAGRGRNG